MKTAIEMAHTVYGADTKWNDAQLERLNQIVELARADEREHIITKNTPEIERCNSHIKALEQEILRIRSTHEH